MYGVHTVKQSVVRRLKILEELSSLLCPHVHDVLVPGGGVRVCVQFCWLFLLEEIHVCYVSRVEGRAGLEFIDFLSVNI